MLLTHVSDNVVHNFTFASFMVDMPASSHLVGHGCIGMHCRVTEGNSEQKCCAELVLGSNELCAHVPCILFFLRLRFAQNLILVLAGDLCCESFLSVPQPHK